MYNTHSSPSRSSDVLQPLLAPRTTDSYEQEPGRSQRKLSRSRARHVLSTIIQTLLPSFVHGKHEAAAAKPSRNKHLDGLRGTASLIVCIYHFLLPYLPGIDYAYGSPGHPSILQFPILRLLYTGGPMVYIFFVLSGYVLSRAPLRMARMHAPPEQILAKLTSSCFRRWIRLFVPCVAVYVFVVIQIQMGMYSNWWHTDANKLHPSERIYLHQPAYQNVFECMIFAWTDFVALSNPFVWSRYWSHISPPLWTIPVEFRCSMVVFTLVLALWSVEPIWRAAVFIPALSVYTLLIARAEVAAFCAGMLIAEISIVEEQKLLRNLPSQQIESGAGATAKSKASGSRRGDIMNAGRQLGWVLVLVTALCLLSFPDHGASTTPGYQLLQLIIPTAYHPDHENYIPRECIPSEFWFAIAAALLVFAVEHMPSVQRVLCTSVVQYLGHISFALYLVHRLFHRTLGVWLVMALQDRVGGSGEAGTRHSVLLLGAGLVELPFVVSAADLMWRFADEPSVRLARRFERFVRDPDAVTW